MTCTVAQLIEKLQTLPQDAEVEAGFENYRGWSASMAMGPIDVNDVCVTDFTSEKDKGSFLYGRKFVFLKGEE